MALLLPSSQKVKPRHPASDTLRLPDLHQVYWCDGLGYVLKSLLENAGYSQKAQLNILQHFAVLVAPFLGRAPAPESPRWPSFMTDDHTPVEFSWDFHTGEKQPTVRYSFEPIALDAATISNPNNAGAAASFKKALLKSFPSTDTLWFDHFEAYFTLNADEDISPKSDDTAVFWAFDLTEKGASAKAYFFPGPVAQATNRTNLETISAAIASAPSFHASKFPSLETYSQYAYESSKYAHELDMLAIDLEVPDQARLKIYFRDRRTSFESVRENMSLGGRLSGIKFENGMRNLRKLWDALFDTTGVSEYAHLPHNEHRTAGILYNVEFRVHKTNPLVKIYIPVRHYSQSDEQVSRALEWYLGEEVAQRRDLSMAAVSAKLYRRCIKQAFKVELLQSSLGVHTYIGCSIQEGGELRVVAYMNPQESKISK